MMKANELRIGVTVWNPNLKENRSIDVLDIRDHVEGRLYMPFEGIPLTEEWLVKFGFKKSDLWQETWLFFNGFGVNFHGGFWYWNNLSSNRRMEYVHQLQNLYFALTGEELLISN